MPVLIQNINANIVDNLKDTTSMFRLVKGSFGYGDWFEIGYYEAYLQNLMKVIGSEDLNKTRDFGLSYNRDSEFKVVEVSEASLAIPCVPPTTYNGVYYRCGSGTTTFDLDSTEGDVAPFDYTTSTFEWYEDVALTIPIIDTANYLSPTATVYVKVISSSGCESTAYVNLVVDSGPTLINGTFNQFDEGGGQATFNLASQESIVAPFDYTTATFEWYEDAALTIPIVGTSAYVTTTTVVYVKVINPNGCYSVATVDLNVI